jgi:hypothetical protein
VKKPILSYPADEPYVKRIWRIHVPHNQLKKVFGWELLSLGFLSGIGIGLVGFHRFWDSIIFFSLACLVVAIQILFRIFTIRSWLGKAIAIVLALAVVCFGDRYLLNMVAEQEDEYYGGLIKQFVAEHQLVTEGRLAFFAFDHVEFYRPPNEPHEGSIFLAGSHTSAELFAANKKAGTAYDAIFLGVPVILSGEPSQESGDQAFSIFRKQWDIHRNELQGGTFGIRQGEQISVPLLHLTITEAKELKIGKKYLYVAGSTRWRDAGGCHELPFVHWLQPPADKLPFMWHMVGSHNNQIDVTCNKEK